MRRTQIFHWDFLVVSEIWLRARSDFVSRSRSILLVGTFILCASASMPMVMCQEKADVYKRIGILKGQVRFVNHHDLGDTPANNLYIVFQRVGCGNCLFGIWTDINGNYEVFLGQGRYRIIVEQPSPPVYDLLDAEQRRVVRVRANGVENTFNVRLRLKHPS
jgi:hypothetical protein